MHKKRFNTFLKSWVQLCVGAIPRLPSLIYVYNSLDTEIDIILN